ncbi:MAG: hypothetical protein QXO51_06180 [Halobacteria archaeon]
MNSRVPEIEAELEGLNREGERVLAHLEALKAQFDRGLISRPLYEKTVEEARTRLVAIDQRIPVLMEQRERLGGKAAEGSARPGEAALEPPAVRGVPARRSAPAAPFPEESRKAEEALEAARQSRADLQMLRPVLEALAPRLAAVEDRLKEVSLPELQGQVRQMLERQARLEAHAREMDRAAKAEFQRLTDLTKPLPAALEKLQEDISTARIEIKALKYEAEALNNLHEDRIRALEEAAAEKRR